MRYKLLFLFTLLNNFISFSQDSIVGTIQLTFQDFELEIDRISVWDEEGKLKLIQKDTAVVYLELGESIEGQKIKINTKKNFVFKVYQRFENSVTVMDEGPHCDLIEWKHYNSNWKELRITEGEFITASYRETDWEKFIEVNMNELREAVRNQCGDRWAEHIKDVKSPNEYPCGVSASRIFLKIEWINLLENIKSEQIISFEIPMGC